MSDIPQQRDSEPGRAVVYDKDAQYAKPSTMPNNLGLADPTEQSKTNDLIGARNTGPIPDTPTEEEQKKVADLAQQLNEKK
ncbi:hypothetical protein OIO90_004199 [Microbotryomycetes sp. JL221]|nr:hypothetical protein OIO90_004199 [Microbotryomycetes sp. JL221]